MPLTVNVRLLESGPTRIAGELAVDDFAADFADPLIKFVSPMSYELGIQRQGADLAISGKLSITLGCTCARCLMEFRSELEMPEFAALATFIGEEAVPKDGDIADLTPLLREDILLGLPANPLCRPDCRGLARKAKARDLLLEVPPSDGGSPWGARDRLKL